MRKIILTLLLFGFSASAADEFNSFLKPLFDKKCSECHGRKKTKGKINLFELASMNDLLKKPELIKEVIEVVEINDMPPEDETQLTPDEKTRLISTLKGVLQQTAGKKKIHDVKYFRLNRWQYNYSLRDLFDLRLNIFPLPEKLLTRDSNYLFPGDGKMSKSVNASNHSARPIKGLAGVDAFPKDLRASHGFDNQADQLSLSPLMLDAFLKLSVSIVDSPDFNEKNVGIWNTFFKEPVAGADLKTETRKRLIPFLFKAFRGKVDESVLNRYTEYVSAKTKAGMTYTKAMKKVASAVLCSPMFLYRYKSEKPEDKYLDIASKLSYFLWNSSPNKELLNLARNGKLSDGDILNKTIDRMLGDSKIERFLDTFPVQWMQLETIISAVPDPKKFKFYNAHNDRSAGEQMVLEPLLLFDAVFIENRPVIDLVKPDFAYRNPYLQRWYAQNDKNRMTPEELETEDKKLVTEHEKRRKDLQDKIVEAKKKLDEIIEPVKSRLLAAKAKGTPHRKVVNIKPFATWNFEGNLKSNNAAMELKAHGKISYSNGMVNLNRSFLQSKNLPFELKAKTFQVWFKLHNHKERGGGVMGIQGKGDFFDTIVLGERKAGHWISGSNGHRRTQDISGSKPEKKSGEIICMTAVYNADGTTALYRNGIPYGKPYKKGAAVFPKGSASVIFGLRHLPPGGNKHLNISIDKANFYNIALSPEQVNSTSEGALYVSDKEITKELAPNLKKEKIKLVRDLKRFRDEYSKTPPMNVGILKKNRAQSYMNEFRSLMRNTRFERTELKDPRYGGIITNAAVLTMTSAPKRTQPITRGAWIIEVIFNDPPPPPPNDVPALDEENGRKNMTIREKFAEHRKNPDCAGCHNRLDPLGFALENFDVTGLWRDKYENSREVDPSGSMMRKYEFKGVTDFKDTIVKEKKRFAKAFAGHLMRYALERKLTPAESIVLDEIVAKTAKDGWKIKSIIREVILSKSFLEK